MNKWFFIEDIAEDFIKPQGVSILSLRPEACFKLETRNIRFQTIEDFYEEKDLFSESQEYFLRKLKWFAEFDSFIKQHIPACREENMDLAMGHYYQLTFFIDSLVTFSYALRSFFLKAQPSSVHYIARKCQTPLEPSIYNYPVYDIDFLDKVTDSLCQEHGIPFSHHPLECAVLFKPQKQPPFKTLLGALGGKAFLWFFKYKKYRRFFTRQDEELNALFLHAGVESMDHVLKEMIAVSRQLYFKDNGHISEVSDIFQHLSCNTATMLAEKQALFKQPCADAAAALNRHDPLIGWINRECGIDVSCVAVPFLKFFVESICCETLVEQASMADFLRRKKIRFLFVRSGSERQVVPALIAAGKTGVERLCFQHGCSLLDFRNWHVTELNPVDTYYTTDTEARNYFCDCLKYDYVKKTKVFESSHYLRSIRKSKRIHDQSTVMFVPHRIFFGFRCMNNHCYPITWFYQLQKALIDCFGKRSHHKFIYKIGAHQFWSEDTVVRYIFQKGYRNISVVRKNFIRCLDLAGKVCFDHPSTALYEAAMAGLPVMSLCADFLPVWQPSMNEFGKSIQKFSSIEDAVAKVEEFLDGDNSQYLSVIATQDNDFLSTLRNQA